MGVKERETEIEASARYRGEKVCRGRYCCDHLTNDTGDCWLVGERVMEQERGEEELWDERGEINVMQGKKGSGSMH